MKKLLFILLGILIIPMVLGADYEECSEESNGCGKVIEGNDLLIMDVDVKVDGLTSRNLDYGDEISRKAKPESEVIFEITVRNNHTSLDMDDIVMMIEIEDLDLEKETDKTDLNDEDEKIFSLTFDLPTDTEDRDYEVKITITAELSNGTDQEVSYDLDLVVEFDEEDTLTTTEEKTTLDEIKTAIDEMTTIQNYYEPYTTCTGKLATAEATIVTRDAAIATLNDYKAKYETCSGEKTLLNNQIITLQIEKEKLAINATSYMGEVKNVKDNRIYIIGIVILIAGFVIWKYKERLFPKSELNAGGETGK